MADEKNGAVVTRQELLQPLDALEVQVVGGLVKQKQVWVAQQELGQGDAHLPAAREVLRRLVEVGDGKAQTAQDRAGTALELVATQALEAVLCVAILLQERLERGTLLGLGDLCLELAALLAKAADLGGGGHDLGERALVTGKLCLLLEIADGRPLLEGDGALVTGLDPHDDLEQRGLAGTIGTDKRPTLARV